MDAVAQLRVTAVDWVQGRPEIPHIAINGMPTMLQAVAEGGDARHGMAEGGAVQHLPLAGEAAAAAGVLLVRARGRILGHLP